MPWLAYAARRKDPGATSQAQGNTKQAFLAEGRRGTHTRTHAMFTEKPMQQRVACGGRGWLWMDWTFMGIELVLLHSVDPMT
jgi:hypothetical protein